MKKIIVILCLLLLVPPLAEARGYRTSDIENVQLSHRERFTTNPDGILSAEAVRELDAIALSLRERGIVEVAIVAVKSIDSSDTFSFAVNLFDDWGVGNKQADNGLGILLVEELHEIRFVTGYGIEHVLSDARCVQLQHEYMLPYFRDGDYDRGMIEGLRAVDTLLSSGELERVTNLPDESSDMLAALFIVALCILLPIVLLIVSELRKTKCPRCGKHGLKVVERSVIQNAQTPHSDIVVEILECQYCRSRHRRTKQEFNHTGRGTGIGPIFLGGFGGGRGFGGGGGFGGGFGGGSFGGGGGGSRW